MEKTNDLGIPVVTLSNGLRVANFSSPHNFAFTDGNILLACSPERAKQMELICKETEDVVDINGVQVANLTIEWRMSNAVADELTRLLAHHDIECQFDILLVPLPVMTALKEQSLYRQGKWLNVGKARCVRMADRVTKAAHIDRFCI